MLTPRKTGTKNKKRSKSKFEELRNKLSERGNIEESTVILRAKSKIKGDKTPYVRKIKCEDNFPEVGNNKKTVISILVI